jgi:hypothetical protein
MKKIPLIIFLYLIAGSAFAQKEVSDRASWQERTFIGGGGGLGGGTDRNGNKYFNFSVSPVIGYMITSKVAAGAAVSYSSFNYTDIGVKFAQYGVMPFLRYNLEELFLTAEYNYINIPTLNGNYDTTDRIFTSRMLAGAGYTVPVGGNTKLNVVGMYDLAYNRRYFASPWVFRVFFTI